MKPKIEKWKTLSIKKSTDFNIFSIDTVRRVSPRTRVAQDFFTIQSKDWLNIIAITSDKQVVLIEQFRHGTGEVELEIPGGIIETNDVSPASVALRELKEETGYTASKAIQIGNVNPNPALFHNTCYTFLVPNAKLGGGQDLEDTEDIFVRLFPVKEIQKLISSGRIRHGLVVAAFYLYEQYVSSGR